MKKHIFTFILIFSAFGFISAQTNQPLKITEKLKPELPRDYETLDIEGTITLRVELLSDGKIGYVDVINSLTSDLDNLAVEAAKKIKFQPRILYEKATKTTEIVVYSYSWKLGGWKSPSQPLNETYKYDQTTYLRWDIGEVFVVYDFGTELNKFPESSGVVIIYGKKGFSARYGNAVKKFISNNVGVNPERVSTVYGGESKEPKMELWLVPKNAVFPKIISQSEYEKPTDFDDYSVSECDPCDYLRTDALKNFASELKKHPETNAYIIVRPSKNESSKLKNRYRAAKAANTERGFLTKLGIKKSRIFTIVGNSNDSYNEVNLWILPPDKDFPKSTL